MSLNVCANKLYNICQISNPLCICRANKEDNKAYAYPIRIADELVIDQDEDEKDLSDPGWTHVMHDGL